MFDPLGLWCQHFSLNFKLYLQKVCKMFAPTEMDVPISDKSVPLHSEGIQLLRELISYKPVLPRVLLVGDEYIKRVYIASDGSVEGMSCTSHALTSSGEVKLLKASNRIGTSTVPTHELHAVYMAAHTHSLRSSNTCTLSCRCLSSLRLIFFSSRTRCPPDFNSWGLRSLRFTSDSWIKYAGNSFNWTGVLIPN